MVINMSCLFFKNWGRSSHYLQELLYFISQISCSSLDLARTTDAERASKSSSKSPMLAAFYGCISPHKYTTGVAFKQRTAA